MMYIYIEKLSRGARGKEVCYRSWEAQELPCPHSSPPPTCGSAGRSSQEQLFVQVLLSTVQGWHDAEPQSNHSLMLCPALHQS